MGLRYVLARGVGSALGWTLKNVFRRNAASLPGKIGLRIDSRLIAELKPRVREASIVVAGTNGKTTVTNMLADALEVSGKSVICNRTGANLGFGVASALINSKPAQWGVFECDELWLARVMPQLQPDYALLLNLFRDQLDRMGEIELVRDTIIGALASSPCTTLIYNADDPVCQAIADSVSNVCIPFGIEEDMTLAQNEVVDANMCQRCDSMLEYDWLQYGQLGSYACPHCGFARSKPAIGADAVKLDARGVSLDVHAGDATATVRANLPGSYMAYNVLAVSAAGITCGVPIASIQQAIAAFSPDNGRLQTYTLDGSRILLNLAKNPTGFNQNLRIIEGDAKQVSVAFFINDNKVDGRDVSWLWDCDFQELAAIEGLKAYAGGIRRNDMQVRLKYAGIESELVDGAENYLARAYAAAPDADFYVISNYTALWEVKAELDRLKHMPARAGQAAGGASAEGVAPEQADEAAEKVFAPASEAATADGQTLRIVHVYSELLNLYGDGGNVTILAERARRRGLDVQVEHVAHGEALGLEQADIVFLGGGPDREQHLASDALAECADELRAYVEDDGALLAICGGYQILGQTWLLGEEEVPGLGILDAVTKRAEGGSHNRLVGNIALESSIAQLPVVGYENHAGRTFLGAGMQPFGRVIQGQGWGNNDTDGADGALYRSTIGTYLHGPLLAKNPEVADWLIERALERRARKAGMEAPALMPLDDAVERRANENMTVRMGIGR